MIIKNYIKKIYYLVLFFKKNVKIKKRAKVDYKTYFEGNNIIYSGTIILNSKIGFATYIGDNSRIENTNIGKYCSIAPNVKIITGTHPVHNFVSTHPSFFSIRCQARIHLCYQK